MTLTKGSRQRDRRRRALFGFAFILPAILGIIVFQAGPVIAAFGLSLFRWSILEPAQFIGLENFRRLFSEPRAVTSLTVSAVMVLLAVLIQVFIGLLLAAAVQRQVRWLRYLFRSIFFFPFLVSGVITAIALTFMFGGRLGLINYYITQIGLPAVPWLTDSTTALVTVTLAYIWSHIGFAFIIFVAAISNLPQDVLDAADIDGATGFRRLRSIIFPLISPTVLFVAVIGFIDAVQIFDQPFAMTDGGPGDATRTIVMLLYEQGFQGFRFGYASAISTVLFVAIALVTTLQFRLSKRWVFYQ